MQITSFFSSTKHQLQPNIYWKYQNQNDHIYHIVISLLAVMSWSNEALKQRHLCIGITMLQKSSSLAICKF